MGRLVGTGVEVDGHSLTFVEQGEPVTACELVCTCGRSHELTAYEHPWVILELKQAFERHLKELGIRTTDSTMGSSEVHRA